MTAVLRRFPSMPQIIPVFSVIVLIVYTWTLMWFFWEVPSWLYYLRLDEILVLLAYAFATNLAESVVVLCAPLLLAAVLPKKWFLDVFVPRGAAVSIAGLGFMIYLAERFSDKDAYPTFWLKIPTVLVVGAVIAALAYLCGRVGPLRKLLEALADRASIFAYVLTPLSLIAALVVGIRFLTA